MGLSRGLGVCGLVLGVLLQSGCETTPPVTTAEIKVVSGAATAAEPTPPPAPAPVQPAPNPAQPVPAPAAPKIAQPAAPPQPSPPVVSKGATQLVSARPTAPPSPRKEEATPAKAVANLAAKAAAAAAVLPAEPEVKELVFVGPPRAPEARKSHLALILGIVVALPAVAGVGVLVVLQRRKQSVAPPKRSRREELFSTGDLKTKEPLWETSDAKPETPAVESICKDIVKAVAETKEKVPAAETK